MVLNNKISEQQLEILNQLREKGGLPFSADAFELITNREKHFVWRSTSQDGNYIIRMPKNNIGEEAKKSIIKELKHESEITQEIAQQNLSFPTSVVKMHFGDNPFAYHKEIPGQLLSRDVFNSLSNMHKAILAKEVAKFLCELHSINLDNLQCETHLPEAKSFDNEYLKNEFDYESAQKALKKYGININDFKTTITDDKVLCHNDLHGENLTINIKDNHVLNGVFDFGNADIANRSFDFIKIANLDRGFCRQVVKEYNRISAHKVNQKEIDYQFLCWHAGNINSFETVLNNQKITIEEKDNLKEVYNRFQNETSQRLTNFRVDCVKEKAGITSNSFIPNYNNLPHSFQRQ